MESKENLYSKIRNQIAKNELDKAIHLMKNLFSNSSKLDEVLLQSGRLKEIESKIRLGEVSDEIGDTTKNKIRIGLLNILRDFEISTKDPKNEENSDLKATKIYNINHIDNANFS